MKTQINHLVNGCLNEAGSSYPERNATFQKVLFENQNGMSITVRGFDVELEKKVSTTGKTHSWQGVIPVELYKEFFGTMGIPTAKPSVQWMMISQDLKVYFYSGSKKMFYNQINESEVLIK